MIKKLLFLCYLTIPFYTSAMIIGPDGLSPTQPVRFNAVQVVGNGVRIAGFAALWGGFVLANAATTGIFDCFFPVAGTVSLNGGNLVLDRDLDLNDVLNFTNLGNIFGNGHAIVLPAIDMIPSGTVNTAGQKCYTWSNVIMQDTGTIYHDLCITFTGSNTWMARGGFVQFQPTCTFYIASNSSLMFRDMTLVGGDRIFPLDSTSTLSYNNMTVVLDADYTFSLGRLDIIDGVMVQGEGRSFIFSSTTTGHINSNSRFMFGTNTTFKYAPFNSSRTNFVFDDGTGQLVFNSATLSTSSVGLQLTKGAIMFDGLCMLVNQGNSAGTSLQIGDGAVSANNVTVRWFPACNVNLVQGVLRDSNV